VRVTGKLKRRMMDFPVLEDRADEEYQRAQSDTKRTVSIEGKALSGSSEEAVAEEGVVVGLPTTKRRSCLHVDDSTPDKVLGGCSSRYPRAGERER
jgi:hypothetical protein